MKKIYTLKAIETPRLIIRLVKLGDEVPLNKAINNSLESLQRWQPLAKDPSLEATRSYIIKGVSSITSKTINDLPMVIIHKKDQKIIGASEYNDRSNPNEEVYEIGYWCDVNYQGKGYVTEYVNALTRYAFEELKAQKIVIRMETGNIKSIAVAKRLKFKNQGTNPSVSRKGAEDYLFTRSTLKNLPPLEISWDT